MPYNPATGQDDPDYSDPNQGNVDPNTGQPPPTPQGDGKVGPAPGNDSNQIQGWYSKFLGRQASDAEIQTHLQNPNGISAVQNLIANSPEAMAYAKKNQQGPYAPPTSGNGPAGQPAASPGGIFGGGNWGGGWGQFMGGLDKDPRSSDLVNTLLDRSKRSLDIDPTTDSVIRPQVDNYAATQERSRRHALDSMAEAGSPYSTGAMDNARVQSAEVAGQNTANLQSTLMSNELTARRGEIQNALQEAGSMLTGSQQMQLQQELGLIDSQLKQQGINSGNDQFLAQLGLSAQNQGNYWDAIRSGLIPR